MRPLYHHRCGIWQNVPDLCYHKSTCILLKVNAVRGWEVGLSWDGRLLSVGPSTIFTAGLGVHVWIKVVYRCPWVSRGTGCDGGVGMRLEFEYVLSQACGQGLAFPGQRGYWSPPEILWSGCACACHVFAGLQSAWGHAVGGQNPFARSSWSTYKAHIKVTLLWLLCRVSDQWRGSRTSWWLPQLSSEYCFDFSINR